MRLLPALLFERPKKENIDGAASGLDEKSLPLDDPAAHANGECSPRDENTGFPFHGPLLCIHPAGGDHVRLSTSYVADALKELVCRHDGSLHSARLLGCSCNHRTAALSVTSPHTNPPLHDKVDLRQDAYSIAPLRVSVPTQ